MFEITQYLERLKHALKEKNRELLEEIGEIPELDDQYDYEDKDIREISRYIAEYIEQDDENARQAALTLIEEFNY